MPSPIKVYFYTDNTPPRLDAVRPDGRKPGQISTACRARTKKQAREILGCTQGEMNNYVSEVPDHPKIDHFPEGVLLVCGINPGDLIRGQAGWQLWSEASRPADDTTPSPAE